MLDRVLGPAARSLLGLPDVALRLIAGRARHNDRGDALDLRMQALLRLAEVLRLPKMHELEPAQGRRAQLENARLVDPSPPEVSHIENRFLLGPDGPIPLRVYRPRRETLPILVFLHGGGFVIGGLDTHDGFCRALAMSADCIVVSVDYRLAPEHRFPAAVEDSRAAFRWAREHAAELGGDPERVAIGGDSAGGNLSAVVCHLERDAGEPMPCFQLLIYPAADMTMSMPSIRALGEGFFLEKVGMDWFLDHYLVSDDQRTDPRASPLFLESCEGLPPAHVVTAGFDPLRDEGEAYAQKLRDDGVTVTEQREADLVHGFVNMAIVPRAAEARERVASALRAALC